MLNPTEISKTLLLKRSVNMALNILRQELSSRPLKDVLPPYNELYKLMRQFSFDYKAWERKSPIDHTHEKSRLMFLMEAAQSYLEKNAISREYSSSTIDFKRTVPTDIWRFIFNFMTKVDLAMLQQANAYFKNLVDAFKKTRDYKLLITDHFDYSLPPRQKDLFSGDFLDILSSQAISSNHFFFTLKSKPYIYDSTSDKRYPLFAPEQPRPGIVSSASNNHDELYLSFKDGGIEIYRLDDQGIYVKLQALNLPLERVFITVISRDRFLAHNSSVIYLCQKSNDGTYSSALAWSNNSSCHRTIYVINSVELLIQAKSIEEQQSNEQETSILRLDNKGKYIKIQCLDLKYYCNVIRINSTEFLLHDWRTFNKASMIKIFKKNASDLYEVCFEKNLGSAHHVIVLKNEDLLVHSQLLETYGKSRNGYGRVTKVEGTVGVNEGAYVSENNDGDLLFVNDMNLHVKLASSSRVCSLTKLSTPVEFEAISSSGNMLISGQKRTTLLPTLLSTLLLFRNSARVFKKFAADKISAKSVLKRLENAILFSQYGATDKGGLSFFSKGVIKVEGKDVVVHSVMVDILNRMTEAKKSIAMTSPMEEDRIYSHAILDIKAIIMKYKGESVKSRLYLFRKLIEEFEQNRAAHAEDLTDEMVAFGYQDESLLTLMPSNSNTNFNNA